MDLLKTLTLKSTHATLVPLSMEHSPALIEAVRDGELWKIWHAIVPSPENMAKEIKRRLKLQQQNTMLPFTIIDNMTQELIGMTALCNIAQPDKRVGIGWT